MKKNKTEKVIPGKHGVVCNNGKDPFGYFGWPTVARMEDGELVVAASGLRTWHVDPYGKTVVFRSSDDGTTWKGPTIVGQTPIDNRDGGVTPLGGSKLLCSWFTSDTRKAVDKIGKYYLKNVGGEEQLTKWQETFATWTDEMVAKWLGSWISVSDDGKQWSDPIRVPVSAPHGPIKLRNGSLLYLGNSLPPLDGKITAACSLDDGHTWTVLGTVKNTRSVLKEAFCEPHVIELPSGKLLGLMRYQYEGTGFFTHDCLPEKDYDQRPEMNMSMWQTESLDGGQTWKDAWPLNVRGLPPHLLRHSSGALICTYGYRHKPPSHRVMISRDDGKTWDSDHVLRRALDNDGDIGYGSSVELSNGEIFTVYYQKPTKDEKASLLSTQWRLPS